jgi:aminomethyltransferase
MEHDNKKTPLYEMHKNAGGKIVDFHGWLLPIQYSSILKEHEAVRNDAGLFDVSHMGELEVSGEDALEFLQKMLVNDVAVKYGRAVYSPMCYPDGGTVDDLIVYKQTDTKYLLVVNAANTIKDFQWLEQNITGRVNIINRSDEFALLALQGPKAVDILRGLMGDDPAQLGKFRYIEDADVGGIKVMLSRTGYTGEDGFELYCRPEDAAALWSMLLEKGSDSGLIPAGLGARDTLRMEAGLPLYGQELSESISPVMAGLKRFIKPDKGEFIGRDPLVAQLQGEVTSRLIGFEMIDRAVPRTGYEIHCCGRKIGHVTSGGYFPSLKKNMGMALVEDCCTPDEGTIQVQVRGALCSAGIVKLPFYSRK